MTSRAWHLTLLILAGLIGGGALAGCGGLGGPTGIPVPWNLTGMGGVNSGFGQHHAFDPAQAETMTTLDVHVETWPASEAPADEWLTQTIDYGSDAVTITLRLRGTDEKSTALPPVGGYDTGGWVTVALGEPLRSRKLVDGATGQVVAYPPRP